jgi:competence protein ComEA
MLDRIDSYRWLIVALLAIPVVAGAALMFADDVNNDPDPLVLDSSSAPESDVRVYITGAVVNPGVYSLTPDLRWIDALEAAGGATPDADLASINLATRVEDEDMIVVPASGSAAVSAPIGTGATVIVNINTASEQELDTLPGIGEVRANRIVVSRQNDGPFAAIDDLLTRELVPSSVFEEIAPLIAVN